MKWRNWAECMTELKLMNWHEWLVMNALKRMNWNEWLDMNELTWTIWKDWIAKSSLTGPLSFLGLLCEIELSLQSRAHFVDLIFKKWSEPIGFSQCLCEIELSLQSRAHLAELIFKKLQKVLFFCDFYIKPSSRYSLVHILPTSSPKSGPSPLVVLNFYVKSTSDVAVNALWHDSYWTK